jgi:hypothetical protein
MQETKQYKARQLRYKKSALASIDCESIGVEETHGDSKHAKAYQKAAEMAELLIECPQLDENTEVKNAN